MTNTASSQNTIDSILSNAFKNQMLDCCIICDAFFTSTPIFLPCGWTICDSHLKNDELKSHYVNIVLKNELLNSI
jgi:hypothetical protein